MLINALIDAPTATLLTLSTNPITTAFLVRAIPDSEEVLNVSVPNYPKGVPIKPQEYPERVWDKWTRLFSGGNNPDERVRKHVLLTAKKTEAFAEVARIIGLIRAQMMNAVPLQDVVYMTKRLEAERFVKDWKPGQDADPLEYPYVTQYSDLSGLSPQQAANEILLKARLYNDGLFKSEYFRLKYMELIRDTHSVGAIDAIVIGFRRELYGELAA
jgi:hypothetical protein